MADLVRALEEVRNLPDHALQQELNSPSGMIPGYLVLGEMRERRTLRSTGTGEPKKSVAEDYIGQPFAQGGMVSNTRLNPFIAYTKGLRFQKMLAMEPNLSEGISSLPEPQAPAPPVGLETLVPLQPGVPGQPEEPRRFARGGVVNQYLTPYQRALLETISGPESGGRYNVIYGGRTFSDYSQHPGVAVPIQSGPNVGKTSSAAGKYQFIGSTWKDIANRYNIPDFSPASQDAGAWYLAKENYGRQTGQDLDAVLQSGDPNAIAGVGRVLNSTWTSLPSGIEAGTTANRFVNTFSNNLTSPNAMGVPATLADQSAQVAQQQAYMGNFDPAMAQAASTTAAQTAAATNPMSGIMGLAMMQMMQQPKVQPAPAPAPVRRVQPQDPQVITVMTSQTPQAYRRRRRRSYG